MSLASVSIRRPVLATVLSVVIVLFGAIALTYLPVREFPAVDPPVITVSTSYRGANADVIEAQVTEPLEDAINGVEGIRSLTSTSREGRSTVVVEFELGADLDRAANDVRDRVSSALGRLPPDIEPPEVSKADADNQPIVQITLSSGARDLLELTRFADEVFAERLQTIPGVSEVTIWGERSYAMRLALDPQKLAAYQLTLGDVRDAVGRENVELPSGRIEGRDVELPVRTVSRLTTVQDFENLIVKAQEGRIVRLRDVGSVRLGARNERTVLKEGGVPMVAVVVRPQPGSNYIEIVDEFYRRVSQLERDLPSDIELGYGFDTTRFIRRSITEVEETIAIAFALVVGIIFLFLRDWRTTLVPAAAIPVSLIGAFFILYLAGFSINVLTLLAIVLAIGIVVDDAIIVLENIYTKIEAGKDPRTAGEEGTQEIFFAVIATTLALVGVFLPILFVGGLTGRLFREFGVTLAGAVAISAFVALSLTPMLSTRLLKRREKHSWFYRVTEPFFEGLSRGYRSSLERFLVHRWLAWPVLGLCLGAIVYFWLTLPKELAPLEDRSSIRMTSRAPEGATYSFMDSFTDELVAVVAGEVPPAERRNLISVTAPGFGASSAANSSFVRIALVDPGERARSQQEIAAALEARARRLTDARTFVTQEPTIAVGQRRGLPIEFVLQAPDIAKLERILPTFLAEAGTDPTFTFVDVDLKFNKPELTLSIDRDRARDLGVSALAIGQVLQLAFSEQRLGYFIFDGKQYEILSEVAADRRDETVDVKNLYVRAGDGRPIQLDRLITVKEESRPPQLYRFDRWVSATVSANLAPGKTIGDGIEAMEAIAGRVLDDSYRTALSGQSRDFQESSGSLLFVFVLAGLLIYLVLAAQFESFSDSVVILLTVPLAAASALFSLWYAGQTLNIFSQIGMIMLIGLVTKNGILIVEFANQRQDAGLPKGQAVLEGASARLRPVLMTTLSTALGILPVALSLGAGSESRMPMGVAVLGGLTFGTLLALYLIPAFYTFLSRDRSRRRAAQALDERADRAA
ncbi:MAG TPA: efflux RND transporter permease subunit [Thermoanaerobaculia bacterium]|nr:efflux RND transporter permease subunit [Thermoanaerobaculia bacterium]